MSVSLGMNGFGRIGRYLLRLLADSEDIRITAINARADIVRHNGWKLEV